jgi:hypothetical protein
MMMMTMDISMAMVNADQAAFELRFRQDLSALCGISTPRILISDIQATSSSGRRLAEASGGVVVTFGFLPSGDGAAVPLSAEDAFDLLTAAIAGGGTIAGVEVVDFGEVPVVPCPFGSDGFGSGMPCPCTVAYYGSIVWVAGLAKYSGECKLIVPCAPPGDNVGMFDISRCNPLRGNPAAIRRLLTSARVRQVRGVR